MYHTLVLKDTLVSICSLEKLSMHDFALKSSAQMANPELTRARSNKQLLSLQYPQELANFMYR